MRVLRYVGTWVTLLLRQQISCLYVTCTACWSNKLLCFIYMSPLPLGYGSLASSSQLSLFLAVSGLTLVVVPETQRHPTVTCARTNLVRCTRIRVKYNQAIKRWRNVRRRAVT